MSSGTLIALEMALVLGLVVAFGVWQLRSLSRLRREREENEREKKEKG